MSWREGLGLTEETERLQPGHNRAALLMIVIAGLSVLAIVVGVLSQVPGGGQ